MLQRFTLVAFMISLPSSVSANPTRVGNLIRQGGPVVVVCAPMTCSDAVELSLRETGRTLHDLTGGRVLIVTAPVGLHAEPYAAAGESAGLGPKDVLLARSDAGWAVRAPGLSPAAVEELRAAVAKGGTIEAGVAAALEEFPRALAAQSAQPELDRPPERARREREPSDVAGPQRAAESVALHEDTGRSTELDAPVALAAANVAAVAAGLWWWRRRSKR